MSNARNTVNISQAATAIKQLITVNLVPMLHGSPGLGKSDIVRQVAKETNLYLLDERIAQADPTDLKGLPGIKDGKATFLPFDNFPTENTPIPEGYDGWLIFLDELPGASPAVQKAAYKLILDRMVGNHPLHPNVRLVAAGNLITDNAFVEEMSTALKSRMVHLELALDVDTWLKWAYESNVNSLITSFITWKKSAALYTFKPDTEDYTYGCPRTWGMVNEYSKEHSLNPSENPLMPVVVAGIVGNGLAAEFIQYCKLASELISVEDILKDPEGVVIPDSMSATYAIVGALAEQVDADNLEIAYKFLSRLSGPMLVVGLRGIIQRNRQLFTHPTIMQWISVHSRELTEV